MKRLLAFLAFTGGLLAQPQPFSVWFVDPTGRPCQAGQGAIYATTGGLFTCQSGVFTAASGSGTFTALTGDATSTATGGATSVVKVNGGSVPTSASILGSNSSGQLIAGNVPTGTGYYFKDDTPQITAGAQNTFPLNTLLTLPNTAITQQLDTASAVSSATVAFESYSYTMPLAVTSIPAGTWTTNIYAYVSSTAGNRTGTVIDAVYDVIPQTTIDASTLTATSSGTTRTFTASTGTPFVGCVAATSPAAPNSPTATMIQTPKGVYQVVTCTSSSAVVVSTPSGYGNESAVTYKVWKPLFFTTTPTITVTSCCTLYAVTSTQSAFTVNAVDTLGELMLMANSGASSQDITYTHNGTTHYSNIVTTLATGNFSNLVPYTGATTDVNLGTHGLSAASVTTSDGTGGAGAFAMPQGTARTPAANSVGFQAPTSVPSSFLFTLPSAPAAGYWKATNATPSVISVVTIPATDLPAALANSTSVNGTPIPASSTLPVLVASGTASLGTSTVNTGVCSGAIDGGTATGVLTTDVIFATANADPTGVTGYTPATTGTLYVWAYPTADHVNFKLCNNTSANITPGSAVTLNWKVIR